MTMVMKMTMTLTTTTMIAVMASMMMMMTACGSAAKDKKFKDDASLQDPDTGQRFELHSEGKVAQLVDLDRTPQVTRVACVRDRLILRMTDTGPAQGWGKGQVVVGGPGWGCNATGANGFTPQAIYVKLLRLEFVLDNEVILWHAQAGPFDMLEEAQIHFHYDPGKKTHPKLSAAKMAAKKNRFRRSLSNLVSNILNRVDWHVNASVSIPFNIGDNGTSHSPEGDPASPGTETEDGVNATRSRSLALHKSWGQRTLTLTRGQRAQEVKDDFVLFLDQLSGDSELTYTFDLVIKNMDGDPQIVKYVNQYDLQADLKAEAAVSFQQEMGVTFRNVSIDTSPTLRLLRVPLVTFRGRDPPIPPVYLVVSYHALSQASVSAYSAGKAHLSTGFTASGFLTASQQADPKTQLGSDVTSRNWTVDPQEQKLRSPYRTHVDFSVYQKLYFTSAVSWHYHDVDIELSPPMEITIVPEVKVRSSSPGVSRCVSSSVSVSAHVHAGHAQFTADAFGLHLWDVPLQPAMTRDLDLISGDLGQGCEARCHGPPNVTSEAFNTSGQVTTFDRHDPEFNKLRAFSGNQIIFHDGAANATWCGQQGTSCYPCSQHAVGTSADVTCAARLMTTRAVEALTLLADLCAVEWPDKRVLVLEAWDEPTSDYPSGQHSGDSLHKAGRALTLGLADDQGQQETGDAFLEKLSQLAVCAGFDLVEPGTSATYSVEVAVAEDGWTEDMDRQQQEAEFWQTLDTLDVSQLSPQCASAPRVSQGARWPPHAADPALQCGPADRPLHRGHRQHMLTLVHWNLTAAPSLTFAAEGLASDWCGYPSRPCRDLCDTASADLEPWDWCNTRMMTPRVALRVRKLQKLAEDRNIGIKVLQAFTETFFHNKAPVSHYHEGRALKLTTVPSGHSGELASLAVCAGFDVVSFSGPDVIEVFVKAQDGFQAELTDYIEGPSFASVSPVAEDDKEYSVPLALHSEDATPALLDGGGSPDTPLSQHAVLRDVTSSDRRYFRLDPYLLQCLELAGDDFSGKIEVIKDSVYRTRSANVRVNLDLRHPQELWRFQAGQAMEVRPAGGASSERLQALATSILRECPPLVRRQMRALGLGCHRDRLYVDFRPVVPGHEREYVMVWEGREEGGTEYCQQVRDLQRDMILGGPVVQAVPEVACKDRGLDPDLQFLSFQMGQPDSCKPEGQAAFCRDSQTARARAGEDLKRLLMSAAGQGRLDPLQLHGHIMACLVNLCGGCPGVGEIFDRKVRACSGLVRYYVDHAASPLPADLTNSTAFYNIYTRQSTVHALACSERSVCVEHTPLYSLFATAVTARYYPDPTKALERAMFASDVNPTPVLELVSQEMAFRAKGKVVVYIQGETDIHALRTVLKVLMAYNHNVTMVEFHVAPGVDKDMVTSSIQRKLEAWSAVVCPRVSRFAMTPFKVVDLNPRLHRRSTRESAPRNDATARLYDWEQDWLSKMF